MKRITMAAAAGLFVLSLAGFGFAADSGTAPMQEHQALCANATCCGGHSHVQNNVAPAKQGTSSIFKQIQPSTEG